MPDCRLFKREWDNGAQRIIYPGKDPVRTKELRSIESTIKSELRMIKRYVTQLRSKGDFTVEELLQLYRERKDSSKLLGFAETLSIGLEKNVQHRTAQAYLTAARALIKYNMTSDISLNHITPGLIRGFEKHLRDERKMPNTIAFYIRNLKSIYNKAIKSGLIDEENMDEKPFAGISTAAAKTAKRALPLEQLQTLHALRPYKMLPAGERNSRKSTYLQELHWCWRYFFFSLFARGMSWVDMAYLRKENVKNGMIRYRRKKTGQQIEIRLTRELKSIIDSFSGETAGSPYVFPIIRNNGKNAILQYESAMRTQNNRLKKLAEAAGIEQNISTHVARHSWASVGRSENLSIKVISECLGHASEETTLIYLTLLNNRVLDEANERVENAVKGYVGIL
jgi:integrase